MMALKGDITTLILTHGLTKLSKTSISLAFFETFDKTRRNQVVSLHYKYTLPHLHYMAKTT